MENMLDGTGSSEEPWSCAIKIYEFNAEHAGWNRVK
jgi:hypothetical protein